MHIGTKIYTILYGKLVGKDSFGNTYYEENGTKAGPKRRWVIYNGTAEASRVPAEWHGWMHHTFEQPPTEKPFEIKSWEKEHVPNLTGTSHAYHPPGSLHGDGDLPRVTGDYEAWQPE